MTAPSMTAERLTRALRAANYEILPLRDAEAAVLTHVPHEVALTVTTTEHKGLDPTIDLAVRLRRHGYAVAPHLAARNLRDGAHLRDIVDQLADAGIDAVVVIGGDAPHPAGGFPDALSLLEHLDLIGHPFASIGIGGYPEGHGRIERRRIDQALLLKAPHATQVITQLCFHPQATIDWAVAIKQRGVDLPVRIGIPGVVDRQKLIRIAGGLGLGQSARFLAKQQSMLWRFLLPGGYRPDRLVRRLSGSLGRPEHNLAGFHVFTFNELARTQAWRTEWLERLS
jgi:methylenetetrahydrofolate reductase (NADPH)